LNNYTDEKTLSGDQEFRRSEGVLENRETLCLLIF
jgi:hypothetical protein